MVNEGDLLPVATLTGADGGAIAIAPGRGRGLVLFFYPKADTPGCTAEAGDFDALANDFANAGADVVGVSRDTPAKLARFAAKHGLAIPLGSDTGALSDAFGFWGEKAMYGRTYMGMERATVLADAEGRVVRIWRKVKVPGHAAAVLEACRQQESGSIRPPLTR